MSVAPELAIAADTLRSNMGDEQYESSKTAATWMYSAAQGFLPINPIFIPAQLAMLVIFTLILIFIFGTATKSAIFYAYIAQALIVMFGGYYVAGKLMKLVGV